MQTLVIVDERWFSTESIVDQHSDKVDHLKEAETFAGETNPVADRRQHSQTSQVVGDDGDFAKPGRHSGNWLWRSLDGKRCWLSITHRDTFECKNALQEHLPCAVR